MMYFTHLGSYNNPGNTLQKQVLAILRAESNWLIKNSDEFVKALKAQIYKLNSLNPRCRPIILSAYQFTDSIGLSFGSQYTASFHLYPVKNPQSAIRIPQSKKEAA